MDLLDVSKENIQPLKRGRNISTLSIALQAQTDAEVYQQLMKEREEFEILVRSYSGDDPLKPWYDYVLWVEQNFPKHGREGNLKLILENCLTEFKDSEQYSQDERYIDLWTRYMSFADDPLQMYKQIHAKGIGASCAIFYHCWAEEYEKANDMKRADQIYIEGIRRKAQPLEELISAHTNFQVRVARNILGQNPIPSQEYFPEERSALSTLRAHGRKRNQVDSTRVGNSVKHVTPGVLRTHSNIPLGDKRNGNVQTSKLVVYNEENTHFTDAVAGPQLKSLAPLPQQSTNNKENTLKPGRWNEGKFKKKNPVPTIGMSGMPATPRNPTFQVHEDEDSDVPRTPKTDIVVSNVLKVRRHIYDDEKSIPVAIFEPHDPTKIAMYPKKKVYSGGTEFSLEELRAIRYFTREKEKIKAAEKNKNEAQLDLQSGVQSMELHLETPEDEFRKEEIYTTGEYHSPVNVCKEEEGGSGHKVEFDQQCSWKPSFEVFVEPEEEMELKMKNQPPLQLDQLSVQCSSVKKEKKHVSPSELLGEVPGRLTLTVPKLFRYRKDSELQQTNEVFKSGPSFEQKESDQSLTVNTKAVLDDVKDMWVSSPPAPSKSVRASFAPRSSVAYNKTSVITAQTKFPPFKVFSDGSINEAAEGHSINVHVKKEGSGKFQHTDSLHFQERDATVSWGEREVGAGGSQKENTCCNVPRKRLIHPGDGTESVLRHKMKEFRISPEDLTSEFQTEPMYAQAMNPMTPKDKFIVYADTSRANDNEMSNKSIGIPFVPSPGMTTEQYAALKDSEDKENMLTDELEAEPQHCKSRKNILQPSKDVYFVPLEQQLAEEEEANQGTTLSDETCFTEAFAMPLVSSTPMVHPALRVINQEDDEPQDNTVQMMNWWAKKDTVARVPCDYDTAPKTTTVFTNHTEDFAEHPSVVPNPSVQSTQLSTILELSERKKSSSLGTTDGSYISKSSAHELHKYGSASKYISPQQKISEELELQDELSFFRNGNLLQKNVTSSEPLHFFSSTFRDDYLLKTGFPSDKHRSHIVQLPKSFDVNIRRGSPFVLGDNHYSVYDVISKKNECLCFTAFESFSKRMVKIEVKDNAFLWEEYIKGEIRHRIKDQSLVQHFIANKETYIFTNKHLLVFNKHHCKTIEDIFERKQMTGFIEESEIVFLASQILKIISRLHECNIVHGSLSVNSIMNLMDSPSYLFLSGYKKAVDITLLPPDTHFNATEESLYYMLHGNRLLPFQVDYIALANVLHNMIFGEPMKVHEEMGRWYISSSVPSHYEEKLWSKVFNELLNNKNANLLHLCYLLEQHLSNKCIRT